MVISLSILLKMSNVSENKLYRKSKHAIYVQYFFP